MITIGQYRQTFTAHDSDVRLQFFPNDYPIDWQQVSITSNYLSTYLSTGSSLINHTKQGAVTIKDIADSIAYVANELIENAIKFNARGAIEIAITAQDEEITMLLTNNLAPEQAAAFLSHIKTILEGDAAIMFLEKIEANANNDDNSASGLGLLSLMMDYNAVMGWQFEPVKHKEDFVVRTMAQLPISGLTC